MRFMSRFAHFSRTSLHGIVNALRFVGKELDFLDLFHSPQPSPTTPVTTQSPKEEDDDDDDENNSALDECLHILETSCWEVNEQTSDLVQYYLIRNGIFQKTKKPREEVVVIRRLVSLIINVQTKLRLDTDPRKKEKLTVTVDVDKSVPQIIMTDRKYVSKVLTNIVSNAIKYTNEGYVNIVISNNNNVLTVRIEDSGCGIKKKRQDKLFEAFIRNETKKDSFSIGLVITKSILDLLKGSIEVHSEGENRGTIVTVSIPYGLNEEEESKTTNPKNEKEEKIPEEQEKMEKKNYHDEKNKNRLTDVLIIEDNPVSQIVFKRQVEDALRKLQMLSGVQIHQAMDGSEALKMLNKKNFHRRNPIILCDIDMPVCNGMQFCRIMRKHRRYGKKLVIYSLTAKITGNEEKFCDEFGFDGIHAKPVYPEDTERIIKFMIGERRRRLEQESSSKPNEEEEEELGNVESIFSSGGDNLDFMFGKEEEDEKESTSSTKRDEERKVLRADVAVSCLVGFVIYFLLKISPEDFYDGWNEYWLAYLVATPCQYVIVFVLGLSSDTNAIFTLIRLFFVTTYGNEVSYSGVMRMSDIAMVSFIVQANDLIEDFGTATFVSSPFFLKTWYYALSRPFIGIPYDDDVILRNRSFLGVAEKVALAYFLITIVIQTLNFRKSTMDKKRKWEKIINDRKVVDEDISMTASKISHDLATPASALVLYVVELKNLLETNKEWSALPSSSQSNSVRSKVQEYFKMMFSCSLGLELAIHNFLTCCKVKHNMIASYTTHEVDFVKFLNQTLDKCESIKPNQTEISIYSPPFFCDHSFSFDVSNVRLILLNTVINAYVHSGAENIQFSLLCDVQNEMINVVVMDDGCGVSDEIVENVESLKSPNNFHFRERFQNALGLGLVVCKLLSLTIEGFGFSVSNVPAGTKVTLRFPYAEEKEKNVVSFGVMEKSQPVIEEEEEVEEELEEEEGEEEVEGRELTVSDKIRMLKQKPIETIRVLCLDDSPIIVQIMERFVRRVGFVYVQATTRENEFLQMVQETKYDILLTDLNLTRMNCIELLRSIPNFWRDKPTVVMCVTGSPGDVAKLDPESKVVDAVMTKPFVVPDIVNTLGRFVSGMNVK